MKDPAFALYSKANMYLQNGTLKLTTKLTESEARTAFSGEQVKLAGVKYKYKRDINTNKLWN